MTISLGPFSRRTLCDRRPQPPAPRRSDRGSGRAAAAPVNIRYATGGGIGPNEMETIICLDYLKQNV